MKNQRKVWLAAGLLALVAAACYSDPTADLQSGAVALKTTKTTLSVVAGDSVSMLANVVDAQGNSLPVGSISWVSSDANVAVVNPDVVAPIPGDIFARAFIRGVSNQAGVATVTVTAQGVTSTIRVTVLPKTFPGVVTVSGTPGADTIILNRPAPQTPLVTVYSAGDTLVLNSTASITFSATTSTVSFGAFPGYIVARSATQIKAVARQAYAGPVTLTNLTYAGDAATGPIAIASLKTDSIPIQHGRFKGTAAVAVSAFGPNTQLTITAPAGMTFSTTNSNVLVSGTPAIVLSRTAGVLTAIIAANITGSVMVTKATVGLATTDSLRMGSLTTVSASFFPGTVTNPGGGLADTIFVSGAGNATFTTSPAASASVVTVGGVATLVISRTATLIKVITVFGASGAVVVTNPIVAGVTIPSLQTQAATTVDGTVTHELNEPANDAPGGAVFTMGLTAAPSILIGTGNVNNDIDDHWTFTLAAAATVTLRLDFGGTANSIDFDMWVRNAANTAYVGGFGAATGANPENLVLAALPAGTYHIVVDAYAMAQTSSYKLTASHP